jgi:hypothetical protein
MAWAATLTATLFLSRAGLLVEAASIQWALLGQCIYNAAQGQWVVDTNLSPAVGGALRATHETGFSIRSNYCTNYDYEPPYDP